MKATLIIQGDLTQINLEADTPAEQRLLATIREKRSRLLMVGQSNIRIGQSEGGALNSSDRSKGINDGRMDPEAVALVFSAGGES